MSIQLRPMTLGEILDRTAELYRNHFLLFAGTSAIFAGGMLLMQMLHVGVLALIGYPHIQSHLEWAYAVAIVAELLAIVLLGGLSIAAFNHVVAWVYLGQSASVRGSGPQHFLAPGPVSVAHGRCQYFARGRRWPSFMWRFLRFCSRCFPSAFSSTRRLRSTLRRRTPLP